MKPQQTWLAKASLRKNEARGIVIPDFKLHYKAMIIKRYDNGMKTNVQINGIQQSPETNPPFDDQLTYDKIVKDIQWDKDILLNK